jgi:hypothetical protein
MEDGSKYTDSEVRDMMDRLSSRACAYEIAHGDALLMQGARVIIWQLFEERLAAREKDLP